LGDAFKPGRVKSLPGLAAFVIVAEQVPGNCEKPRKHFALISVRSGFNCPPSPDINILRQVFGFVQIVG